MIEDAPDEGVILSNCRCRGSVVWKSVELDDLRKDPVASVGMAWGERWEIQEDTVYCRRFLR
jgi:hypothetical protein